MKTIVIFSMALVASNAFFLPRDFFDDISHRFMDLHTAVRPHGPSQRPHPPFLPETTNDATHQRMGDLFNSLTPEEQSAMKNHLFGERFPKPMPASHHGGASKPSSDQIEAAREKWASMTPEQRRAFREKYANDEEEVRPRSKRSLKPEGLVRPAHHGANHKNDDKIEEIRARWESMTPEEREEVKNGKRKHYKANQTPLAEKPLVRSPRSFQAIKPLPEVNETPLVRSPRQFQGFQPLPEMMEAPVVRNPRQFQGFQPLPEMMEAPVVRNPRQFQAIQPLPEMFDTPMVRNPRPLQGVQTLPGKPQGRPNYMPIRPYNVALNPEADYSEMMEKLKGMTEIEQIKYIRELFPSGMPIRPLKGVIDTAYGHDVKVKPAQIQPAAHNDEMKIRPYLFPIAVRPLLPLEIQPIFPLPFSGDNGDEEEDDKESFLPEYNVGEFAPY